MKGQSLIIRFSAIEALYFAMAAVASYQTSYLMEVGLSGTQIGTASSLAALVGMAALPLWGILSDWRGSAQLAAVFCIAAMGILYLLLPFYGKLLHYNAIAFLLYLCVLFAFKQPANALLDGWAVGTLAPAGISYSTVRMWGSIGYAAASMLLSLLANLLTNTGQIFYFMVPLCVLFLLLSRSGTETRRQARRRQKPNLRLIVTNRRLLVYLIYCAGLHIYLAITLVFMAYILAYAHCKPSQLGFVIGFRAIMEIGAMIAAGKLQKKFRSSSILVLSGLLFGAEHLLYRFAGGLGSILAIMVLSGLAGGVFYSIGPDYLRSIVSPAVQNTAQSLNGVMMSLVSIVGTLAGGMVITRYGVQALTFACGCIILMLTLIFVLSLLYENAIQHKNDLEG